MTKNSTRDGDPSAGSSDSDHKVGYGRPPVANQFRPGRSGNPKGRPKAVQRPAAILSKLLNRTVVVQERGRKRRITLQEAIFSGLVNDAARRDPKAMQMLLTLIRRLDLAEPKVDAHSTGDISADDEAIVEAFLAQRSDLAPLSEAEGSPSPDQEASSPGSEK